MAKIEQLEAERDDYKDRWEQTGCTRHSAMEASIRLNEGYRKKIERLEAVATAAKAHIDNDDFYNMGTYNALEAAVEALDSKEQT